MSRSARAIARSLLAAHTEVVRTLERLAATGAHAEAAGMKIERALLPVLNSVAERGSARIGEIAIDIGLDASTVSRHVAALTARGLTERVEDDRDRRAASVRLTDEGRDVQQRMQAGWEQLFAAALTSLPSAERDSLPDQLHRFAAALAADR